VTTTETKYDRLDFSVETCSS